MIALITALIVALTAGGISLIILGSREGETGSNSNSGEEIPFPKIAEPTATQPAESDVPPFPKSIGDFKLVGDGSESYGIYWGKKGSPEKAVGFAISYAPDTGNSHIELMMEELTDKITYGDVVCGDPRSTSYSCFAKAHGGHVRMGITSSGDGQFTGKDMALTLMDFVVAWR